MSSEYREGNVLAKAERRAPMVEAAKSGNQLKKKLSKKQRGEYKIRVTTKDSQWVWNQYRDEDAAKGALRSLERKFSFYFLEVLDPTGKAVHNNREAYDAYQAREAAFRNRDALQPV